MSPPTKASVDAERQRTSDVSVPITAPEPETGSVESAALGLQRAAGNQAVTAAFRGPGAVQRAPNEDDPRRTSGMAFAPTIDPRPQAAPPVNSAMAHAPTVPPSTDLRASLTATTGATSTPPPVMHPREEGSGDLRASLTATTGAASVPPPVVHPRTTGPAAPAGSASSRAPASVAPSAPVPGGGDPRFAVGGEFGPKPVGPGQFGGVGAKVWADIKPSVVYSDQQVEAAYRQDPSKVIRSPHSTFHRDAWAFQGGEVKYGKDVPPPQVWRVGGYFYVAPEWQGPATPLPPYAAIGGAATTPTPAPSPAPGGPATPRILDTHGPGPDRMRHAVSPETPAGPPRGSQQAQKVTYQDVAAALARNPASVIRSPNVDWHRQGFRLDGGDGSAPFAYRVGNLYIIAPTHPLRGVPTLGESAPPKPSALPQAAQVVALPSVAHDEKTLGRSTSSSLTQVGDRTEIRDRRSERTPISGQRVTGHEVQEGDVNRRTETRVAGGIGAGGNLAGFQVGRSDTTTAGETLGATKGWQVTGGLGTDGNLSLAGQRTSEVVMGTTPAGDALKKTSSTTGGATFDPETNTFGANAGHSVTGPGGTTKSATGGVTMDDKGSATATAGGSLESKGGSSITTSITAGTQVVADEPVELPDGQVEVSYRITDSAGGTVGAGQRMGGAGAPTIGGSLGATRGKFQGGTKRFATRKEADAWRKDAGARLRGERRMEKLIPPTTVAGALLIPIGDVRDSGDVDTTTMAASGSYGGTTVGVSKSRSDTRQLSIRRVTAGTVEVTGAVVGTTTKGASISVPVFSNTKSGIKSASFAVTWAFDLTTPAGAQAFERYCRTGNPLPGGILRSIDKGASDEDRDDYKIPFVGSASWSGSTWETSKEDAAGNYQKSYGGKQSHEVKPGLLGKITGDDERSSSAQIVRSSENSDEKTARAELKVSGESGAFNRAELGKIFMDKGRGGGGRASGQWTLSADVPLERIRDLEAAHPGLRNAMNIDEKMRIYSELVKEHGARMLGGQVGITSTAWDLHLKGDSNFPGPGERVRLIQLKDTLTAQLKAKPGDAYTIAREARETIDQLERRLGNVSDVKQYTDLPDGLRQQQVELVKRHIRDFTQLRQRALGAGIRGGRDEKLEDIQARAGSKGGYDKVPLADRELTKLQDSIAVKEKQIAQAYVDVRNQSRALGRVVSGDGSVSMRSLRTDEDRAGFRDAQSSTMTRVKLAFAIDPRQDALKTQIQAMREAMDKTTDPAARLEALKPIDRAMGERLDALRLMLDNIQAAGAIIAPYAAPKAMAIAPKFWTSVGGTPADE